MSRTHQAGQERPEAAAADPAAFGPAAFGNVAREASIRFSGLVYDKLLGYLFALFVAKAYGSSEFGLYIFGVGVFEVSLALATLGLDRAVIRSAARLVAVGRPSEIRAVVRTALEIVMPLGLLLAVAGVLFAGPLSEALGQPELSSFLRFAAIAVPASLAATAAFSPVEGIGRQRYMVLTRMVLEPTVKCAVAVGLFLLLGRRAGVGALGVAFASSIALSAALGWVVYRRVVAPLAAGAGSAAGAGPAAEPESRAVALLRVGLPACASALLSRVLSWAGVFLVFGMVSAEATAHYAVAYRTALLTMMVGTAFDGAYRPAIAGAIAAGRREELAVVFLRVSRAVLAICLPACIVLVLFPSRVVLVLGDQFAGVAPVVSWIAIGTIVSFLAGPATTALTMAGQSQVPLANGLVAGLAGVGLNLVLIPRLGTVGVGIAQCATMAISNVLDARAARARLGVLGVGRSHLWLLVAAAAGAAAGAAADAVAPANKYAALAAVAAATAAGYGAALAALGPVREDWAAVRSMLRGRG